MIPAEDVPLIQQRRRDGARIADLAVEYGVTKQALYDRLRRAPDPAYWSGTLSVRLCNALLACVYGFRLDMPEIEAVRLVANHSAAFYLRQPYFGRGMLRELQGWLDRWGLSQCEHWTGCDLLALAHLVSHGDAKSTI